MNIKKFRNGGVKARIWHDKLMENIEFLWERTKNNHARMVNKNMSATAMDRSKN